MFLTSWSCARSSQSLPRTSLPSNTTESRKWCCCLLFWHAFILGLTYTRSLSKCSECVGLALPCHCVPYLYLASPALHLTTRLASLSPPLPLSGRHARAHCLSFPARLLSNALHVYNTSTGLYRQPGLECDVVRPPACLSSTLPPVARRLSRPKRTPLDAACAMPRGKWKGKRTTRELDCPPVSVCPCACLWGVREGP